MTLELPPELEPFRSRLEATVKPYIEITTQVAKDTTLWQSKFLGFPYLPKGFAYPTAPNGDYLYLLAQINFAEVPCLESFPNDGILQFYVAKNETYGLSKELGSQESFRVLYFANPDLNEANLQTNFDFLPTLWDEEFEDCIPFYILRGYSPHKGDCFSLKFSLKHYPITTSDYQLDELVGQEILDVLYENNCSLWNECYSRFEQGHKLGGYPYFTQEDPRAYWTLDDEEPWRLLLQIDSDDSATNKIHIQWGDVGVANFFIKESALKRLDFSNVLYNWDCS